LTGRGEADHLAQPVRRWLEGARDGDAVNALLMVDARLSLADDLLLIGDHMSMQSSVELRVPFLDLEFLALVERMPGRYKLSRTGARKWLYRRAVRDLLPTELRAALVGRRARWGRKLGFTTQLDRAVEVWATTSAPEFLTGPDAVLPEFARAGAIDAYLTSIRRHRLSRSRQLLALYVLESWLRRAVAV
jgi:hypothetical protein